MNSYSAGLNQNGMQYMVENHLTLAEC